MAEPAYAACKTAETRPSRVAGAEGRAPTLPSELANLQLWFCSESEAEQEIIVLRDTEQCIMQY